MQGFLDFCKSINEATVGGANIGKASDLIARYFSTKADSNLRFVDNIEASNSEIDFIQCLYRDFSSTQAIGVNWTKEGTFISVSFWENYPGDPELPTRELFVNADVNSQSFAKILPMLVRKAYGESSMDEAVIFEKYYDYNGARYNGKKKLMQAMIANGEDAADIAAATGDSIEKVEAAMVDIDAEGSVESAQVTVKPGKKQINKLSAENKETQDEVEEVEYADPNVVFDYLNSYVRMIGNGYITGLFVAGRGGVGKSYNVTTTLKELGLQEGKDYVIKKGNTTPVAMYGTLYNNYNKIVIFDDCDAVFKDQAGMNILKAALDTGERRVLSWNSNNACNTQGLSHEEIEAKLAAENKIVPSEFEFFGSIIFITNLTKAQVNKKDPAVLTRCTCLDITLKSEDIELIIKSKLPSIKIYKARTANGVKEEIGGDMELKKMVFDYLTSDEYKNNPRAKSKPLNFRTFIQTYIFAYTKDPHWKELALNAGG